MELGNTAHARGFRLLALDKVDSTNSEARRLIDQGERGPLWIVADRQSAGRGRLGREWQSPPGNLYASLILSDFGDSLPAPQLGFVIGVAAMRALRACVGDAQGFALKWPNDLLFDGAKLGGALLENVGVATGDARAPLAPVAIIGIGVNCVSSPRDLPYEARALSELGAVAPSAATFFAHLSDAFVSALDLWRGGQGFPQLREEWLRYASGVGKEIAVVLAQETLQGRFETIDATGRLVLATAKGPRAVDAGDIILGPRSPVGALA